MLVLFLFLAISWTFLKPGSFGRHSAFLSRIPLNWVLNACRFRSSRILFRISDARGPHPDTREPLHGCGQPHHPHLHSRGRQELRAAHEGSRGGHQVSNYIPYKSQPVQSKHRSVCTFRTNVGVCVCVTYRGQCIHS
jgi:hypothetical protein